MAASNSARMGADGGREFLRNCAHCGDELTADEAYPVTARPDEDGEPVVYSFCDHGCLAAWEADA